MISLFLANLKQAPREWENIPTWNSDFVLNAAKIQDLVSDSAASVSCNEMLKHTLPLRLSIPACLLLAPLKDLTNCVDKKQWEVASCPGLYIRTIAASSFLLTFSHMVTLENSSLISLESAGNSLVEGCLLLSLILLLTSGKDLAWKGETCSELSACN